MGKIIPSPAPIGITHAGTIETRAALANIYCDKHTAKNEVTRQANAIINTNLQAICMEKPDLFSTESIVKALSDYFTICQHHNSRPTISGIAISLGLTRKSFLQAAEAGTIKDKRTGETIALPADVFALMSDVKENYVAMIEGFMETGLLHPASGIFLLKNNGEYKDVVERHYNVTQTTCDLTSLAEKYNLQAGNQE